MHACKCGVSTFTAPYVLDEQCGDLSTSPDVIREPWPGAPVLWATTATMDGP